MGHKCPPAPALLPEWLHQALSSGRCWGCAALPCCPGTHHKHKLKAFGRRGSGRRLGGGVGGQVTGGTEGLSGDPALGVLLLILLCKRNGAWDPVPAAGWG